MASEGAGGLDVGVVTVCEAGPEEAGDAKELGSLQVDHSIVGLEVDIRVATLHGLQDFAGTDVPHGNRDLFTDFGRRELRSQINGVGEEGVSQKYGGRVSVGFRNGRSLAADVRPIHDVVVDKRCEMDDFDDRREFNEFLVDAIFTLPSAKEDQRRANAFSPGIDAVFDIVSYFGFEAVDLFE